MAATVLGEHRGRPCVLVASRGDWRDWLAEHHADHGTIWLARWKRGSGQPHVSYDDVVEEALCFGWVDSTVNAYDADRSVILVAPRKRGSSWSRVNKERIERLEAAGLLTDAGRAVVERARADGTWTFLDDVEAGIEPPDLAAALDADPAARTHWDGFSWSSRKGIMTWVISAKRPATRSDRVATTVRMAAAGLRAQFDPDPGPGGAAS